MQTENTAQTKSAGVILLAKYCVSWFFPLFHLIGEYGNGILLAESSLIVLLS